MTVSFSNIRNFQDYFLTNNRLEIPAGQALHIQDVRPLGLIRPCESEVKEPKTDGSALDVVIKINKLLAPIGQEIEITPNQNIKYHLKKDFYVLFPVGAALSAEKATLIYARASELFALMVASSRMTFKLEAGQAICFIDLKEEIFKEKRTLEEIFPTLLEHALVPGYTMSTHPGALTLKTRFGPAPFRNNITICNCIMEFPLTEIQNYSYITERFIERMIMNPKLKVPPLQKLVIKGDFSQLLSDHERWFKDEVSPMQFIFEQLFLPYGKNVKISPFSGTYAENCLELSDENGFLFELVDGLPLCIDLRTLGNKLIAHDLHEIHIQPDQWVVFYGVKPEEKTKLSEAITSQDGNKVRQAFIHFLYQRLNIGFGWEIEGVEGLNVAVNNTLITDYLYVKNSMRAMSIALIRPEADVFGLSMVQNCSKELQESLRGGDVTGILNFLFKSIFYFCCDNFRYYSNEKIPPYFQRETQSQIEKTLKDEIFSNHLKKIVQTPNLLARLNEFNRMTPDEFDEAKLEAEDESIIFIINRIKKIAAVEHPGSQYLTQTLSSITTYMDLNKE